MRVREIVQVPNLRNDYQAFLERARDVSTDFEVVAYLSATEPE
jgi:hypothetical protein